MTKLKYKIKEWFKRYFGYEIIGYYYKTDENGLKTKKPIKKYYLKRKGDNK